MGTSPDGPRLPFWQQTTTPFFQRKIWGRKGQAALQLSAGFSCFLCFLVFPFLSEKARLTTVVFYPPPDATTATIRERLSHEVRNKGQGE